MCRWREAERYHHLRPFPQPPEPPRRCRPRRRLQHLAPLQRSGSLRPPSPGCRLVHHGLGYSP
nr:uncharacterized protein CTRU02_00441 [Colletotrichum truncatum]KAF6801692.1 hypothetical protein CTRU02_00441 [Colletotrichum truncatum]